jgi:hypothetical protein
MDLKLYRALVVGAGLALLCGLALLFGSPAPSYAGGPDATPACECTGGGSPTPVPETSSVVGYVYDYTMGVPVPHRDIGVELRGCSWSATWGTDDNGYFYFRNLGAGVAHVNLQLPPGWHPLNPNVVVQTSGLTETYTVYMGYYTGDVVPGGPFTTPDGQSLTELNGGDFTPPGSSPQGAPLPDVGGSLPDSYLVIGLSAMLLAGLPLAGFTQAARVRQEQGGMHGYSASYRRQKARK